MTPSVALTRASFLKEGAYHIGAYKKKEEKSILNSSKTA